MVPETVSGNDGYPLYRRRSTDNGGQSATLKMRGCDVDVDNRWVVPYSPILSKAFQAHINVEYCNSVKSIKYICKYVNKGSDMAVFAVESRDEILQYQLGRYISSNEATWRIFSFPIHERYPTVVHLAVHLENGQRVYFTSDNAQARAEAPPATTLTAFFALCLSDLFAKNLLYSEVPTYYTWNTSTKKFVARKEGKPVDGEANKYRSDAIGRIYTVHPNNAECFFLRLLLVNVRGPTSFQALRTVEDRVCETYREACQLLNLLEDDSHWNNALADASETAAPQQIRFLFAVLLTSCAPSSPQELWEKHKESMSEDFLRRHPSDTLPAVIFNQTLLAIENICRSISNKSVNQLGLTITLDRSEVEQIDQDYRSEISFNVEELQTFVGENITKLNNEQKLIFEIVMSRVQTRQGGFFFLDAPGGTGKTFLISLILAQIRAEGGIALAVASSGIAATLLDGGRTAHSALKLPLNVDASETPTCNITKNSGMGRVLKTCDLIIWDECTMAHKKSLEALSNSLKDIRGSDQIFGNALILLSGDFRQTLPVIPRSTPADEINACLKSSSLWCNVKTLTLKTNMRIEILRDNQISARQFSRQLLDIGNGYDTINQKLPEDFCTLASCTQDLIDLVFPNIATKFTDKDWLSSRAILAPKNTDVNAINSTIQDIIPGN